jgi:hypothetical protein
MQERTTLLVQWGTEFAMVEPCINYVFWIFETSLSGTWKGTWKEDSIHFSPWPKASHNALQSEWNWTIQVYILRSLALLLWGTEEHKLIEAPILPGIGLVSAGTYIIIIRKLTTTPARSPAHTCSGRSTERIIDGRQVLDSSLFGEWIPLNEVTQSRTKKASSVFNVFTPSQMWWCCWW